MVFFSSCNSVKYHSELLRYIQVPCFDIHGKQKQQKRTTTFFDFCKAEKGILLCTDVAARGLDIPDVVCLFLSLVSWLFICQIVPYLLLCIATFCVVISCCALEKELLQIKDL
uniref:ATP-dependent RNA helicase n=1 Tax=Cannabis sativa TaxID=3483 RepID=A0A803R052_CANSA